MLALCYHPHCHPSLDLGPGRRSVTKPSVLRLYSGGVVRMHAAWWILPIPWLPRWARLGSGSIIYGLSEVLQPEPAPTVADTVKVSDRNA
jgi:hypothetical protein